MPLCEIPARIAIFRRHPGMALAGAYVAYFSARMPGPSSPKPRKGQAPPGLSREEFGRRFQRMFFDPAFTPQREALHRAEDTAWDGYSKARKSPITRKAGPGFADPNYDLSV